MASYTQNTAYIESARNLHHCLLALSSANAVVLFVDVSGSRQRARIRINQPLTSDCLSLNSRSDRGISYQQTELNGCLVEWEVQ